MRLRKIAACLVFLSGCAAPASDVTGTPMARWGDYSGSLPPEYAWDYVVTFFTDHIVSARYCKGYAQTEPGCATVTQKLSADDFAAFSTSLAPIVEAIAAAPPRETDVVPIGGGSVFGALVVGGTEIDLPPFASDADASRVADALAVLRRATPADLVEAAKRRARQP